MKFCDETLAPPILAYAHNYSHGDVEPPHTHQCAQFLHALNGVIRVDTQSESWVVTTNQGLWIPARYLTQPQNYGGRSSSYAFC